MQMALTPAQREIVCLVADGLPNKQIALAMGIREQTVKNQLRQVFDRWGVHSRAQAVATYLRAANAGKGLA